jgi:hypothetical protein
MVGWGGLCHTETNRYKRWLTAGHGSPRTRRPQTAADVQSTETPCSTINLLWLLLIPWLRPLPRVDRRPPTGGGLRAERWGDPPTKCAIFSGLLWVCWSPVLQRLPWVRRFAWLWGWCLVRLRPTAPLNSPPRRRGIPSPLRSVGIRTGEEGMCVLGGWRAAVRPGIRGGPWIDGCYGSTREIIRSITKRARGGEAFGG